MYKKSFLSKQNPYFLLHVSVILAGFTGIFGRLITLNEGLLTWYRVIFASAGFYLLLKISKTPLLKDKKVVLKIGLVGLLLAIHWVFFYGSIKASNVSIGVVCYALTGSFTALWVPVIQKKKLDYSELGIGLITAFGISLIFHFDIAHQTGIILGVVSSVLASLYTVLNEGLVKKYDIGLINFYQLTGGFLGISLLLPIYLKFNPTDYFIPNLTDIFYLLLLAIICTVGLYMLFAQALKRIAAFTVSLSFNLEPIYSILLAFLIFNEASEVNEYFYLGLILVMGAVLLQTMISLRRKNQVVKEKIEL